MAHQYHDSAFPVWKKGNKCQLYFMNILPPGEYEGTRFESPKRLVDLTPEEMAELEAIGKGIIKVYNKIVLISSLVDSLAFKYGS